MYGKENAARGDDHGVSGGGKISLKGKEITSDPKSGNTSTRRAPKKRGSSAGSGSWSDKKKPKKGVSKEQLDEEMDAYMKNALQR